VSLHSLKEDFLLPKALKSELKIATKFKLHFVLPSPLECKFAYGGSVLGSSQCTLLPLLPLKMTIDLKVVKNGSKIIISLP